jgi:outer membrane protein
MKNTETGNFPETQLILHVMRMFIKLLTGLFLFTSLSSRAQETWSLQQCIQYALDNNIQIKQQKLNAEYQKRQVSQARSDRYPTVNASLSNNLNFGRSLTYENTYQNVNSTQVNGYLSADVTLWNGFVLQNTIRQKELDLEASLQELEKARDDVILNIAASYLEILFAEELVLVSEAQTEVTQQQIERTGKLVEAGSLAKGALLEIEAQLASEELQLVNNQNRVDLAYLNLYQFLELPLSESFKIEKPEFPEIETTQSVINSIDVFNNALMTRPEIKGARMRMESAKKQLAVAKGSTWPSLSFGANYYNLYNNKYTNPMDQSVMTLSEQLKNNQRYGLGFTLSIPLFNNFRVKNSISNALLQVQDFEYQLQTTKNRLRKEIEQAYQNALAALKRYTSSEKAVRSMEEAFRYTEEKFNVGMVNSVEYNQSKNNLTIAQSDLLQAKYEYIFRSRILDFYNGVPIEL